MTCKYRITNISLRHLPTLATAISRLPLEILCVEGVSWFDPFIDQEISWPSLQILKATIFCDHETEDLDTLNNILASPASSIRHLYVRLATPLYRNNGTLGQDMISLLI